LASLVERKKDVVVTDDDEHKQQQQQHTQSTSTVSSSSSYRLRSVVHHIGDCAQRGHYTTDAIRTPLFKQQQESESLSLTTPSFLPLPKSNTSGSTNKKDPKNPNEVWTRFDDGATKLISEQEAMQSEESQRSAYMILYEIEP
jgi:hypothetical protein